MNHQETISSHYAILIGINAYPEKPIPSGVRDVQNVKKYLKELPYHVDIEIFTASGSSESGVSSPIELPTFWPTHEHVTSALKRAASAEAGDFVYVHFSGHGTRAEPCGVFSNESTGDLALVVLDGTGSIQYLWGEDLSHLIKIMIDKGILVTLVLDCCFSATVYRADEPDVRFLPYNPAINAGPAQKPRELLQSTGETYRDVSMLPNWMLNPNGYAILCASGPDEVAIGPRFGKDKEKHGALTYYLLESLKEVGPAKRHKDIYDNLSVKFRKSGLQQHPVRYGNKRQGFFDHVQSDVAALTVPIIQKRDKGLQLQAGHAHGINDGDQFILCPWGSADLRSEMQESSVMARVTHARAFTSDLERLEDQISVPVKTGWVGRATSSSCLRKFPIQLDSSLSQRDEWLTAFNERSIDAHIEMVEQSFSFHILTNGNNDIEILDQSNQRIPYLLTALQDGSDIKRICEMVEHLVRYEFVKSLSNNILGQSFPESFRFDVYMLKGQEVIRHGTLVELEDGTEVRLVVQNNGTKSLYLSVYALGPCWEIENVIHGSYEVIPPKLPQLKFRGATKKKIKTTVPEELRDEGYRQCQDVIKVFITSRPATFDLLELPKLNEKAKRSPASEEDRTEDDDDLFEHWVALNFSIRTFAK
ncbi:uncharacterized protein N0V89_012363 [Didymosphaeria variabile]|uniref:Peptidase C14 caspase domain-containing protein n=1 Tax=Didymosphaeria variabile TaxID=1932322 RepID=A0A9W8XAY1_9PLEO|nr:uncharacterized protein N0V89_012363 [Didymosphaeria variabile]KAJ4344619.1 hypothetical protein N0V89_012363 [Didymosphaeria variabile]